MRFWILLLLASAVSAQPPDTLWTRTYGQNEFNGDRENCTRLIHTLEGGYLLGGSTGFPYRKYFLVKVDTIGETEWMRILSPGEGHDIFGGCAQFNNGNFIVAGRIGGILHANLYKLDSQGDSLWSQNYGGGDFNDVVSTSDNGSVAVGHTDDFAQFGGADAYAVKVDLDGQVIWRRIYGDRGGDIASRIITTTDGGYLIMGEVFGSSALIIKVDSNGQQEWLRNINTYAAYDVFMCAVECPDGGFIAGGSGPSESDLDDYCLVKFTAEGDTVWSRKWGSLSTDRIADIVRAPGGGISR